MSVLINSSNNEITDSKEICKEVKNFYQSLYSSRENQLIDVDLDQLLNRDTPKIPDADKERMEMQNVVTMEEAGKVLNNMKNDKSPGSDGFSVNFFKFFWKDLGVYLVRSINYGLKAGKLSTTQTQGLITCIPKGQKSKKYLKNWRPITLLNVTYKIASSCIGNRIRKVLPTIISCDQSGFMSDRFVGDNIRLMYDILNYAKVTKKVGIVLLIDFEKAFDSLAWSFLFKTMHFLNFSQNMIDDVKTLYNGIKASTLVNNWPSPWFPVARGCRQGDPVSPYLFIICSEILAHMIRQNHDVKGYNMLGCEVKISQFADDTSLFLDGTKKSFVSCVNIIDKFSQYSGLHMNADKTKVIWFGAPRPPEVKYLKNRNFEWNPEYFTLLGVRFSIHIDNITDDNIQLHMDAMRYEIGQWSKRDLTPFGKITVLKSLVLSKIVHILMSLPNPSRKYLKELEKMFFSFLWNGKPDPITRHNSYQKLESGGISMINIEKFISALKVAWVRRIVHNVEKTWHKLLRRTYRDIIYIEHFGPHFFKTAKATHENRFWSEVLKAYHEYSLHFQVRSNGEFLASPIMYNGNVLINNEVITRRDFIRNKIFNVNCFMKENSEFLTLREFSSKFNLRLDFLTYHGLIRAIGRYINSLGVLTNSIRTENNPPMHALLANKSGSSCIYQRILNKPEKPKGIKRWENKLYNIHPWPFFFKHLKKSTDDRKLLWLQFRIIHHILTTNRSVSKFKPNQCELCTFCNSNSETIEHVMWQCRYVQTFFNDLTNVFI